MPAVPTGTVTFFFSDVEGSTKLLAAVGAERYGEMLSAHRAVMRAAFGAHGSGQHGGVDGREAVRLHLVAAALDVRAQLQVHRPQVAARDARRRRVDLGRCELEPQLRRLMRDLEEKLVQSSRQRTAALRAIPNWYVKGAKGAVKKKSPQPPFPPQK